MAQKLTAAQIRARRKAQGVRELTKKQQEGRSNGKERAMVRVGRTNTKILTGAEDLTLWTDEELKAGKRFDKNGQNRGVAPKIVPKAIHDELVRRTLANANEIMRENLGKAVEALTKIAMNPKSEDKDRIKAIDIIMNRTMGKTPEKINVESEQPPWQIALNAGIVSLKGNILDDPDDEEEEDDD